MANRFLLLVSLMVATGSSSLIAQNYQALHGSSYAGSLGALNNPASIVHVPFAWDITPIAVQAKHATNALVVNNFSLLSPSGTATVNLVPGNEKRFMMANQDLRLLNARFRINTNSAIAFGASIRSYQSIKTAAYNWQDSITGIKNFMQANPAASPIEAALRATAWAEVYGTYARTLAETDNGILNAGATIKISRALGGAYITADNINYTPAVIHNQNGFLLNSGDAAFGYSSNFDEFDNGGTAAEKRKRFMKKTWSTVSADIGAEFIIPGQSDGDEYAYDLKIGASLLDIGYNNYQYSNNSVSATFNKTGISDSLLDATFQNIESAYQISDSVAAVAGSVTNLGGKHFHIFQPTRLVINADKRIGNHFFINAELTLQLAPAFAANKLFVRDMKLASLTPRFETRGFGIYLPATLNNNMQFWLGGALRAGPVSLGVHNWANLFSTNKMQNGGAYLALTFRPGRKKEEKESSAIERIRGGRKSGKGGRNLGCPTF